MMVIFSSIIIDARKFVTGSVSDWGWPDWLTFAGIMTAALTGIALTWNEIDKRFRAPQRSKQKRDEELNDPIDLHFLVPEHSQRSIEYAVQDDAEHLLNAVIIPPSAKTLLELRLHPKTKFVTTHLIFGCHDDGTATARQEKPHPIRLVDVYGQGLIEPGSQPGVTAGHVVNSRFQYRWNHDLKWDGHSSIIIGIQVESHSIGEYMFFVMLVGDELEKWEDLIIRVEKPSSAMLICANGDHSRHSIRPIFVREASLTDH
jgi:hypothetical protein